MGENNWFANRFEEHRALFEVTSAEVVFDPVSA
jgi:hypothetical protein